jgi:methyl-accepting chemotaxis protein-2 (aspartate sensor receptor)
MLKERAKANVANSLGGISNTVEVFNTAMMNEASSFARMFAAQFSGGQLRWTPHHRRHRRQADPPSSSRGNR